MSDEKMNAIQRTRVRRDLARAVHMARRCRSEDLLQYYLGQAAVFLQWASALNAINSRQFDLLNDFVHMRECGRAK